MIRALLDTLAQERRALTVAALLLLQALVAVFFIGDVVMDIRLTDHLDDIHLSLEALAALALVGGVLYLARELLRLLRRMQAMDTGLRAARGEMVDLIETFFDRWGLTPSERDVALMILKGLDNETIARLRGTAAGTVRAQATRVYAKAGVEGRAQLLSVFMEELLAGDAIAPDQDG